MDGDGSDFSFSSATEYQKGQDATDISWADIFLDGIHSDDPTSSESGGVNSGASNLGAIHGNAHQMHHQSQAGMLGGQLQIHIPAQLQGSMNNNASQQAGTKLCGTVTYLAPSASTHQHVNTAGGIHSMMTVAGHHQVAASVGQQQQHNTKLVQIAPSYPVTPLSNSVPLQTLLQPSQTLTGQTIYGGQGAGMFPTQGSVHIENPKVVNVNFGPHVIGSDGSGQQAIIQTAEGKRVFITNSQLQHMSQSISLTQPLVGTQLINTVGNNVIRASLAPGTHTIMSSATTPSRQIVLPSGQTVIPQQTGTTHSGITKNVVLRPLNSNMSPVIYQSGQGGQLIHSQPTLITSSGQGLQVVNTGGGQGNQVQLIAQPSMNQTGMGQQQGTVMNFINNSGVIPGSGGQITGLVPGQNIFVNGQVLSFGQLGSLTMPQLHVQRNPQGGVTLADINAQFQQATPQLVIQQNGQQQQFVLQPKSNQSPSLMTNVAPSQRLISSMLGGKSVRTPTPSACSDSSTPVLTPTPSTPTPTPTPDLMLDFPGGKNNQGMNILKQALDMSDIDLESFEEGISFLEDSADCFPLITTQPPSQTSTPSSFKPATKHVKSKSKTLKPQFKNAQPIVNVTISNNTAPFQQTAAQFQNTHEQNITLNPQQKFITSNGQVYVLSANRQQLILQPSTSSASPLATQFKPATSLASATASIRRPQVSVPSGYHLEIKGFNQQGVNPGGFNSSFDGQLKLEPHNIPVSSEQKNVFITAQADGKVFVKANSDDTGYFKVETSVSSVPSTQIVFTTSAGFSSSPVTIYQTSADVSKTQIQHLKTQPALTLSSSFGHQIPQMPVIKQEVVTDSNQPNSHLQTMLHMAGSVNDLSSASSVPTSSFGAVTTPIVISSAPFTAVATTTTQSHQTTIMSTAQTVNSRQMSLSSSGTHTSYSPAFGDVSIAYTPQPSAFSDVSSLPTSTYTSHSSVFGDSSSTDFQSQNLSPTLSHTSTSAKTNPKEKDSANVKAMIPIKIADSTLFLSLTPGQKEKLENQLSRMSQKDQEGFLVHQQNVIRRSQQVQQKQLELKQQHKQQQAHDLQQQRDQTQPFHQLSTQPSSQQSQQPPHLQTSYYSATQMSHSASQGCDRAELLSPQTGQALPGLPTTVQELMDKPNENEAQLKFQSFPVLKPPEQQQPHYTTSSPPRQAESPQQQQMYSNLQQRTPPLSQSGGPVQHFLIPQIGRCLAEQQLLRDRSLAVDPDVNSPFKSLSDAMRRLVRYHTLQDHKPEEGSKTTRIWDTRYSKLCDYLVKKKRCYLRRFNKMKLFQDMCPEKQPEHIQNLICFNEQLRALVKSEKEGGITQSDLFDSITPGVSSSNWSSTSIKDSIADVVNLKKTALCCVEDDSLHPFTHKDMADNMHPPLDHDLGPAKSEHAQPSSRKRAVPDKGSSGMLKLVFKRGTTDNFVVKNSLANVNELPRDLRPVVNLEKSDSEYEFDSNAADVMCNRPVIVRRRTLSVASRQMSFDAGSDNGSVSSHSERMHDHSSEEGESDDEEGGKSSGNDDDFVADKRSLKRGYHVSFGSEVHGDDSDSDSSEASSSGDNDVLIETDAVAHPFICVDETSTDIEDLSREHKTHHHISHNTSVTSHKIFNSSLAYSNPGSVPNIDRNSEYNTVSALRIVGQREISFKTCTNDTSGGVYGQSSLAPAILAQEEEYVAESPVSSLEEEAARKGLPSSSLFTTPNKSLLETDAMFNSEDEDDARGDGARMVSKFEIDNKDPQSSMIDDSVRSVINSVLNDDGDDDDDDDDDNKCSQASWVSSASSSSGPRGLFQSSSLLIPSGHNNDLDLAVKSILNS